MEYERLGGNNKLFIFGVLCLVTSLGLLFFSLYLLPYFIWELSYNIPDFILSFLARLQDDYRYSSAGSKTVVWFVFFVPCVITGIISYFISHYLDNKIPGITPEVKQEPEKPAGETQKQIKESASLGLQILGLMVIIVVAILLLQYFVQSTS